MIVILPTSKENLKQIALCHKNAFPKQFLSRMGISALIGFYQMYLSSNEIFFVALEKKLLAGFVTGGKEYQLTEYRQGLFKNYPLRFILSILRFEIILSAFKTVIKKIQYQINPVVKCDVPSGYYYLSVISVNDSFRGKNVANKLIEYFEDDCKRRGFNGFYLNVSTRNTRAISFYKKIGLSILNQNKSSIVMIKSFS